jgi:hypothetical protein
MRIELIENRGPNTLLETFRKLLGKAGGIDAQVALCDSPTAHARRLALNNSLLDDKPYMRYGYPYENYTQHQ